jgi:hypothetical protein
MAPRRPAVRGRDGRNVGETRAATAAGPGSLRRLRPRHPKIAPLLVSVVALALGAANLTGQATASAAGQLAATPVAKATCSPTRNGNEAIVDLDSHRSFARLRTVCVGTLYGTGVYWTGVIHAGALFILRDVGPAQDPSTEVVRVDLTTYAIARSAPLAGEIYQVFAGLGDIWVETTSSASSLVQLSPVSLRVEHRFADPDGVWHFVPFAGRLWFIDNYSLKTLNPTDGRVSVAGLPWLPAGLSPTSVTSSGGELYLLASSQKSPETAIATYNPVSGVHRVVRQPQLFGGSSLLNVTGRVLWVSPPGGNMSEVTAYSTPSLRPLTGGFVGGGPNGTWTAVPDIGDLWFQLAGSPLECVSGKTGHLDASLSLPDTFNPTNIGEATPPGFVAADESTLVIAATETHGANPSESGIAVYKLDARCRA